VKPEQASERRDRKMPRVIINEKPESKMALHQVIVTQNGIDFGLCILGPTQPQPLYALWAAIPGLMAGAGTAVAGCPHGDITIFKQGLVSSKFLRIFENF
jgi:hypothetical protein